MSHTRTPWTDILAANWQNAPQAVVLTDMSRGSPRSALSASMKCGCWRVAEYEDGGLRGKMILALRCQIVERFMTELRLRLDQEQKRRGSDERLAISACVLGTEEDNLGYGIDIRRWSEAGLIDEVHIYRYNFGQTRTVCDMPFFRKACHPRGVHVSPMFSPNVDMDTCLREALGYYEQGADGLGVWDAYTDDVDKLCQWGRMGHPDELRERVERGPSDRVFSPIHRIDGEILDGSYPIYWGG